ncbi:hypothetical protein [Arthrobacter sp.]|nr:hypothetical protein [Arthrobacter sp.]
MEITGTIRTPDAQTSRISASGTTYGEARAALDAAIPEGAQLITIRADHS